MSKSNRPTSNRSRVLFLGTRGTFSRVALEKLLESGVRPAAVWVPGAASSGAAQGVSRLHPPETPGGRRVIPLTSSVPSSTADVARLMDIQVFEVRTREGSVLSRMLGELGIELGCVACWPWRLPPEALEAPRHGFLNLHPSLLPRHRGPAPWFWVLRSGEAHTGVTVHRMSDELDAGPILAQERFFVPNGLSGDELDRLSGEIGGPLLAKAVEDALEGTDNAREQPSEGGSYEGWPREQDFIIPTTMTARQAFNFVRGVSEWRITPRIEVAGREVPVREAVGYSEHERPGAPLEVHGGVVRIAMLEGVLEVVPLRDPV